MRRCFVLLFVLASPSLQTTSFQNWDVLYNKAVVGWDQPGGQGVVEPTGTIVGVSLYKCLKHCQERLVCDFVNYYTIVQVCIVIRHIDKTVPVPTEDNNGAIYSSKADWLADQVPHPDCHLCNLTDECVVDDGTTSCQPASCGAPPFTNLVIIDGNVFNIGAKLKITCIYNRDIVVYASCGEDGLWNNANATCQDTTTTVTTTTSTTTTSPAPPPFSCHKDDNTFRTVTLSDGTKITYRVMYGDTKTFEDARVDCAGLGANLLKVTTTSRLEFILSLTDCRAFDSETLWIDGRPDPTTGVWTSWDGDIIPLTTEFWAYVPDSYGKCVRIKKEDGFRLNDQDCIESYNYICEIPN